MPDNEEALARITARCKKEPFPKLLGIKVLEIKPGYARVSMQFGPEMQNIFGMLHGGAVFSLLDEAFQLACNARGEVAVAQRDSCTVAANGDGLVVVEFDTAGVGRCLKYQEVQFTCTPRAGWQEFCLDAENTFVLIKRSHCLLKLVDIDWPMQ